MKLKRWIALLMAAMMMMTLVPVSADNTELLVRSAPLSRAAETKNGMARVHLSSLGSVTRLDLTVVGSYSVDGAVQLALYDGQQISVGFDTATGQITLTANGVSYPMGSEMSLRRHQADGQSALKIAQANRPNNLYPGDLQLIARTSGSGYKLYPIVHVYIEYYLYGVVPYEMNSSWPAEALRAQAVAARTYTLNRMNGRTSYIYDLVDTASDQVYNGYVGSETNATRAVDATKGIVIMNNGKLSGTYYTASNGGQTEAVANAWGSTAYPYLGVKDDPFDLANPNTNKRRLDVYASFNDASQNSTLKSLLTAKAQSLYGSGATITRINSITPHTPKYAAPSRLYTKMDFGVTLSNGTAATLTFSIFDELESALNMSINSSKNELWYVERSGSDFIVRAARYGHGIGMSQRGAQQMSSMGYTYDQILGFYYEGCERVQYTFTHTILPSIGSGDGPVVNTEAPATISPESGANARVQLVGVNDTLPLRYAPSDSGKVLTTIGNGVSVTVLHYGSAWTLIRYGEINGYVPTTYLVTTGNPPTDASASATNITQWATVTASDSLNLRSGGSYSSSIIGSIPGGAVLPVFSQDGSWARVQYGQQVGYCAVSYLTLSSVYPQETTGNGSSAMVSLPGGIGSAPLRVSASTSAAVLSYVAHGTQVTVLSNDGSWCQVTVGGVTGYMLESALDFSSTGVTPSEPPLGTDELYAIVASELSTLNLRSGPSTAYEVIAEIPRGTLIVVTSYGSTWCAVRWGSLTGYVMTEYLSFDPDEPTSGPAATNPPAGSLALTLANADLHEAGSDSSAVLLMIPSGEKVTVLSWGDEWTQVTYVGLTGYLQTELLQLYQDQQTEGPATPTSTPTPSATPVPTFTPVNAAATVLMNAQLRQEPDTGSELLGTIPAGATVSVTLTGAYWSQIAYEGTTGWVLTSQLHMTDQEPTPTPSPSPTPEPAGDEEVRETANPDRVGVTAWIVPTVDSVNLRAAPSMEADVLDVIPAMDCVTVLDRGDTWSLVRYNGQQGHVFTQYLTYAEPASALGVRYVSTATDPLALRDAPSTDGRLLTRMDRGSMVTLLRQEGDWCLVQYGQQQGYCAARYLSAEKPKASVIDDTRLLDYTLAEVTGWEAILNTQGSVFLREWCSTDAPEGAELQPETRVRVKKKGDIWCLIATEGNEGYCLTSQLTLIAPAD